MIYLSKVLAVVGVILVISVLSVAGGVVADKYAVSFNDSSAMAPPELQCAHSYTGMGCDEGGGGGSLYLANRFDAAVGDYNSSVGRGGFESFIKDAETGGYNPEGTFNQLDRQSKVTPAPKAPKPVPMTVIGVYVPPGYYIGTDNQVYTLLDNRKVATYDSYKKVIFDPATDKPYIFPIPIEHKEIPERIEGTTDIFLPEAYYADADGNVYLKDTGKKFGKLDSATSTIKVDPEILVPLPAGYHRINSGTAIYNSQGIAVGKYDSATRTLAFTPDFTESIVETKFEYSSVPDLPKGYYAKETDNVIYIYKSDTNTRVGRYNFDGTFLDPAEQPLTFDVTPKSQNFVERETTLVETFGSGVVVYDPRTNYVYDTHDPKSAIVVGVIDPQTKVVISTTTLERTSAPAAIPVNQAILDNPLTPASVPLIPANLSDKDQCLLTSSYCTVSADGQSADILNIPDVPPVAIISENTSATGATYYIVDNSQPVPDGYYLSKDGKSLIENGKKDNRDNIVGIYDPTTGTCSPVCSKQSAIKFSVSVDKENVDASIQVRIGGQEKSIQISQAARQVVPPIVVDVARQGVRLGGRLVQRLRRDKVDFKNTNNPFSGIINTVQAAGNNTGGKMRIVSGLVYVKTGADTGDGIGGALLDTCTGMQALTDAYGRFAFPVRAGGPYCVRLAFDPGLYADLTAATTEQGKNSRMTTYEWQRAGINCSKNKKKCNTYETSKDLADDSNFAFVFQYKNAPITMPLVTKQDNIKIVSPNNGESFVAGEPIKIRWDMDGNQKKGSYVIDLFLVSKETDALIVAGLPMTTRSYAWILPAANTIGSDFRIKVAVREKATNEIIAKTVSDRPFAVTDLPNNAKITVIAPNGGERFAPGGDVKIAWTAPEYDFVRLSLICENWATDVIYDVPAKQGSYTLSIPQNAPTQALCKVQVAQNVKTLTGSLDRREDSSDATFVISSNEKSRMIPVPRSAVVAKTDETIRIGGRIYDGFSNAPLPNIILDVGGQRVRTDEGGYYVTLLPNDAKFDVKILDLDGVNGSFYQRNERGGFDLAKDFSYRDQTVQLTCDKNKKLCNTNYDFMRLSSQ